MGVVHCGCCALWVLCSMGEGGCCALQNNILDSFSLSLNYEEWLTFHAALQRSVAFQVCDGVVM